jgi:hypothetical protein
MISYIAPLAAGNAVEILLAPPAGATRWRLLRKRADTIAAADDAGANVVADGDDKYIVDRTALVNGTIYYYRAFYWVAGTWVAAASRPVTCEATFQPIGVDTLDIVQERLKLGLKVYVDRGLLTHMDGAIPVLLATPAYEGAPFPLFTVHLTNDGQEARFVGESLVEDQVISGIGDEPDELVEIEGWLSRQQIQIIGWCLNGDVRKELRKALKAIVQANLPVFESIGMTQIEVQLSDLDDVSSYPVPMYQVSCSLSCIAPNAVARPHAEVIKEVSFSMTL